MNAPARPLVGPAASLAAPDQQPPQHPDQAPPPGIEQALAAWITHHGDDSLGSCAADECVFFLHL